MSEGVISATRVRAAYVAFLANKAYYDACEALRGRVDGSQVDFDSYACVEIGSVPETIDFGSKSKRFCSARTRLKEFKKYLCFMQPAGLNLSERTEAPHAGSKAATDELKKYGIECDVHCRYRG